MVALAGNELPKLGGMSLSEAEGIMIYVSLEAQWLGEIAEMLASAGELPLYWPFQQFLVKRSYGFIYLTIPGGGVLWWWLRQRGKLAQLMRN